MASIPDLTEQIKVYETKAHLIYPMLQYLLKWVGERQCTNCSAQKLKWKGHFSFGSTQNHKSWTAIARLLFLIRDLLHFVNSIASKRTIDYKKKMDTPLLDLSWDNQFLDLLWCKYIQYTYYVGIRQRLFEPAPQGLQTSLVYLDVCHSCATVASVASTQLQSCVIRLCQSRERNKSSCSG